MKRIGVLLSGSGFLDGAEIRESVYTLTALEELGEECVYLSINHDQHHVIDHQGQTETNNQTRNLLSESARIARGPVHDINFFNYKELDALAIPGGFGVAKNFCSFAFEGSKASVIPSVSSLIQYFHQAKKPIAAICIAPALLALILKDQGLKLTIGNDKETAMEIEKLGHTHKDTSVNDICIDETHKVVTTGAYMHQAKSYEVQNGVRKAISQLINWT